MSKSTSSLAVTIMPIIISFLMTSDTVTFSRIASSLTVMVSPTVMVIGFFWRSSWMRFIRSASVSRRPCGLRYCCDFWLIFCLRGPKSPRPPLEVLCAMVSNFSSYLCAFICCGRRVSTVRRSTAGFAGCGLSSLSFFAGFSAAAGAAPLTAGFSAAALAAFSAFSASRLAAFSSSRFFSASAATAK